MKPYAWVGVFLVLAGCHMAGSPAAHRSAEVASGILAIDSDEALDRPRADPVEPSAAAPFFGDSAAGPADRQVIYTGDFKLRVSNRDEARDRTVKLAEELGGYVQEEREEMIMFRVPAAKFRDAVRRVSEIGRILSREVLATDVTEEYVDLKIRLEVKKKFLSELQELYAKGGALKDLLEIKREIDKVTEEIERLEGRMRYLTNRIAHSTVIVRFQVAARQVDRTFKLPFAWLETLGVDRLLTAR